MNSSAPGLLTKSVVPSAIRVPSKSRKIALDAPIGGWPALDIGDGLIYSYSFKAIKTPFNFFLVFFQNMRIFRSRRFAKSR